MRSPSAAACLLLLAACDLPSSERPDPFTRTGEMVALSGGDGGAANACVVCHGVDGAGDGAGTPRLAGLDQGYLLKQLHDYADGRRPDPVMGPVARALDDRQMRLVSEWYANLPPRSAGEVSRAVDPVAAALFHEGDTERGLTACGVCHGADGRSAPGGPALAGQPASYLDEQLRRWRTSERRNDPRNLMLEISRRLTDAEVQAVSAYLEGLPVGPSGSSSSSTGAMPGSTSSLSQK
ncbi:c-type cytochrome [Brevundimonas sp.]|uniref:c-type cytochrome n=1 Tax=Brevundimonas sp. TaxID=1871086 RepID=UPI0025D47AA0|nr:c-type cytochrome [Brevundimonas sp.]